MKRDLTTSEKIRDAVACQAVKNLHARHCFMHCAGRNIEEADTYWLRSEDASWGHQFGKWTSWTGVRYGWAGSLERKGLSYYLRLSQVWPQTLGFDYRPFNEAAMHTLATDIIEVARDGKSVRCYFYTPGTISSTLNITREKEGAWMWERYGCEFLQDENGEWKYLTLQVCPDIMAPLDSANPAVMSLQQVKSGRKPPDMSQIKDQVPGGGGPEAPIVNETATVHDSYSIAGKVSNPLPWPEPYETYDIKHSYRYRVQDWE